MRRILLAHSAQVAVRAMGHMSRRGLMWVAVLVMLAVAETASAAIVTVPLEAFLIFSGGGTSGSDAGYETQIAGASLYYGNIGSNWDLAIGASDTHILGSVYAGRNVALRQYTAIGSDGTQSHIDLEQPIWGAAPPPSVDGYFPTFPLQLERVVANGTASGGNATTKIFGNLDAGTYAGAWTISGTTSTGGSADTFAGIVMPTSTFVHAIGTYPKQALSGAGDKTIDPGHWGDLTTTGNQTILLKSGDYYFDLINTTGDKVTLKIDLTSGAPINIYVVGDANFGGQNNELMVKGPAMTDYVLIRAAPQLAALINWETRETFTLGGGTGNTGGWGSIWGGTVYSALASGVGVNIGQHIDWYGALWAYDTIALADHSRYTYVSESNVIPEPSTLIVWSLLGSLGIGIGWWRRGQKRGHH